MKYIQIEVQGETGKRATLIRDPEGQHILALIGTTRGAPAERAEISVPEGRWAMAERLQRALDGYAGAGGDIRGYASAIDLVAGC